MSCSSPTCPTVYSNTETCTCPTPNNYTKDAKKVNSQFASNVYAHFLNKRFGVKTCAPLKDFVSATIRKQMLDWQLIAGVPCDVNIGFADGSIVLPSSGVLEIPVEGTDGLIHVNMGGCEIKLKVTSRPDNYAHVQSIPSTNWVIKHNLGYNPVVRTENALGVDMEGVITHDTVNQLTITFSQPVTGTAYLS